MSVGKSGLTDGVGMANPAQVGVAQVVLARWLFRHDDPLSDCRGLAIAAVIRIGCFVDPQLLCVHLVEFVLRPQVFLAVGVWVSNDVLQVLSTIKK